MALPMDMPPLPEPNDPPLFSPLPRPRLNCLVQFLLAPRSPPEVSKEKENSEDDPDAARPMLSGKCS
jgi:hypothetical protein